jgi:uncharacterized phage protein (TIGR02220 family)
MDGYIKLYKKLTQWQWYKDGNTLRLFIDLLLDANYEDSKVGFLEIKRGQCLTSIKRIHQNTGLTYQQIRTSLGKLEKSGEINKQTTNRYSIITIKRYDDYQNVNKQVTNKQQTNNNIKEYKEEQEYKEINNKYIAEIINHLNLRLGSHYKTTTPKTITLINARLNEKFSVEDFKTVIDKKCVEWMNTDMQKYLRPETLFGTKFESYLNQEVKQKNLPEWFDEDIKENKESLNELEKILEGF